MRTKAVFQFHLFQLQGFNPYLLFLTLALALHLPIQQSVISAGVIHDNIEIPHEEGNL